MKKLSLIILAFVALFLTSCDKDPQTNPEETNLVTVTLELPVDNGSKTDFSDFLTGNAINPNFSIKWRTDIQETVYLAVPTIQYEDENGNITTTGKAQIIPLKATEGNGSSVMTFIGVVDSKLLRSTLTYTLYYMGDGNVTTKENAGVINGLEMSFDNQDGSKANLGRCHFATMNVGVQLLKADDNVIGYILKSLDTNNTNFTTQVALAYLDLKDETELSGASKGVSVMYNTSTNKFDVKYLYSSNNTISLTNPSEKSLVVLAPGIKTISCTKGSYTFDKGVGVNKVYYNVRTYANGQTPEVVPLKWN